MRDASLINATVYQQSFVPALACRCGRLTGELRSPATYYGSCTLIDTVSRTIRFKSEEIELITEFLEKNPIFDFSSLTRIAIRKFIENPKMEITPVVGSPTNRTEMRGEVRQ